MNEEDREWLRQQSDCVRRRAETDMAYEEFLDSSEYRNATHGLLMEFVQNLVTRSREDS